MTRLDRGRVKIAEVMKRGPADMPGSVLAPGAVILAVNGTTIEPDAEIHPLLDRLAGRRTRLTVIPAGAQDPVEQIVTPVALPVELDLAYRRWIDQRRALVENFPRAGWAMSMLRP